MFIIWNLFTFDNWFQIFNWNVKFHISKGIVLCFYTINYLYCFLDFCCLVRLNLIYELVFVCRRRSSSILTGSFCHRQLDLMFSCSVKHFKKSADDKRWICQNLVELMVTETSAYVYQSIKEKKTKCYLFNYTIFLCAWKTYHIR